MADEKATEKKGLDVPAEQAQWIPYPMTSEQAQRLVPTEEGFRIDPKPEHGPPPEAGPKTGADVEREQAEREAKAAKADAPKEATATTEKATTTARSTTTRTTEPA